MCSRTFKLISSWADGSKCTEARNSLSRSATAILLIIPSKKMDYWESSTVRDFSTCQECKKGISDQMELRRFQRSHQVVLWTQPNQIKNMLRPFIVKWVKTLRKYLFQNKKWRLFTKNSLVMSMWNLRINKIVCLHTNRQREWPERETQTPTMDASSWNLASFSRHGEITKFWKPITRTMQ